MNAARVTPPAGNALFVATLTGDIISYALYYSTIGLGKKNSSFYEELVSAWQQGLVRLN